MSTTTVLSPVTYTQVANGPIRDRDGRALVEGTVTHLLVEAIMRRAEGSARATGARAFVAIEQVHGVTVEARWDRADDDDEGEDVEPDVTFNLDDVVSRLHGRGIPAYVEQTGGGCATIYAGGKHVLIDGTDEEVRYDVSAGPGNYGWGDRPSTALLAEFYVGPTDYEGGDHASLPDTITTASDAIAWAVEAIEQAVRQYATRTFNEWNERPCKHCGRMVVPGPAGRWVTTENGSVVCATADDGQHATY